MRKHLSSPCIAGGSIRHKPSKHDHSRDPEVCRQRFSLQALVCLLTRDSFY
jgi:hypothetical protein